ncbi:hypothetical protein CYY_003781 [Polysphondylium violaceum]|uniref:Uncharacterized protein n=1 Tax=Polysphondylium violaceum TaxID=133409 RepID=A0A8J4PZ69_9MYCE|nr:hypothetical protein CYY_003781 [Polysphondylium violaceum]
MVSLKNNSLFIFIICYISIVVVYGFPPPILRTSGYFGVRGEKIAECNSSDSNNSQCFKFYLKKLNTMETEQLIDRFQFGPYVPQNMNQIIQDDQVFSDTSVDFVYNLIFYGSLTPQRSFQILRVYKYLPKSTPPRGGPLSKYYFVKVLDENDKSNNHMNNAKRNGLTIRLGGGGARDKYIITELNTFGQRPISYIRNNEYTPDKIPGFDTNWFEARIIDTEDHRLLAHGDFVEISDLAASLRLGSAFINIPDPAPNAPCGIAVVPDCPTDQVRWITRHNDRCIQKNDCITPKPIEECFYVPLPNCTQHYRLVSIMNQDGCNHYYCDFNQLDIISR